MRNLSNDNSAIEELSISDEEKMSALESITLQQSRKESLESNTNQMASTKDSNLIAKQEKRLEHVKTTLELLPHAFLHDDAKALASDLLSYAIAVDGNKKTLLWYDKKITSVNFFCRLL